MMNAAAAAVTLGMGPDGLVQRLANTELMTGTSGGGDGTTAAAVHAAMRAVAAIVRRARTGEGAYPRRGRCRRGDRARVDRRGVRLERTPAHGSHRAAAAGAVPFSSARYQYYETSDDRFVLFCAIEPKFWMRFCEAVDRRDLIDPDSGDGSPIDFAHGDEQLRRRLQEVFHTRTQQAWIELAIAADIPLGPAHQGVQLRDDPHLAARSIIVDDEHPVAGSFRYVGSPVIVDGERFAVARPAPGLGEHTDEVLGELGIADDAIAGLRAAGVI